MTVIVKENPKKDSLRSGNARSSGVMKLESKRVNVIVISIILYEI